MNLALFSQSSATQKFWFRGSMARQWCVTGCPPAQLLNPRVPSLPQSHVPGVWKSVPDVQYFKCKSLSDTESGKKRKTLNQHFSLSHSGSTRLVFVLSSSNSSFSSYHSLFFSLYMYYIFFFLQNSLFFFSLLHFFFYKIYILILFCQNSRHENQFIFRETRSESRPRRHWRSDLEKFLHRIMIKLTVGAKSWKFVFDKFIFWWSFDRQKLCAQEITHHLK